MIMAMMMTPKLIDIDSCPASPPDSPTQSLDAVPTTPVTLPNTSSSTTTTSPPSNLGHFQDAHLFQAIYQRNNKKGGLKNLRCFPSCTMESHRLKGFCGRPVIVRFPHVGNHATAVLHCFLEFMEEDQPHTFPERIPVSQAMSQVRSKASPTLPWMEGKFKHASSTHTTFEFNSELRGWHYSWESNKHKCDTKHHLVCSLYEEVDGVLLFRDVTTSPSFVLFCRRRKRFTLEPRRGALREVNKRVKSDSEEDEEDGAVAGALLFLRGGGQ